MSSINIIDNSNDLSNNLMYQNSSLNCGNWFENKLNLPYYSMKDSRWSDLRYFDIAGTYYKAEESASSYVALAMILSGLNQDLTINPKTIIEFILGEKDTNNDQILDTYYLDRNLDGVCDSNDSLSQNCSNGSLRKNTLLSRDIALEYSVSIVETGKSLLEIQQKIDSFYSVLVKIPGHYFVITSSNEEYTENGELHYKMVVLDPFFSYRNGIYTMEEFENKICYGSVSYAIAYKSRL